ncbi:glycosyl transferase [Chitinophaga lutea]|uniref:Glycosyl transferase n=1 Tax=Chitinophaga lutea TaxID=2488634 RepID=A0A3N4PNC7_9BACT|nr:glycosyltransferase family 39 protein [Chitinophaga lutea]RPE05817.1 glycosyl transferase [Chitinophaga lutea]
MNKKHLILAGFVLLKFILHYSLIGPEYELHRDEFLYLDQARHPAWGYISVPPLTAWLSRIVGLLGNGIFWVKFFPALFGALTMVVVWKAIESLKGNLFALILGATGVLFSVLLRLNILYQPNSLDVLCWTAFYYALIRYIQNEHPRWLYIGAVVFAIGFLNKYNVVFQLIGLLPAILLTEHRRIFTNRHFYFAILTGLVLIAPNLVWQYSNNFPVVWHMKELAKTQLVNVDRVDFLKTQLLFFLGALFIILAGLYALWAYAPFRKYRLFFWALVFTLATFIYFKAKDYYAIGLYPVYIAFGAAYLGVLLQEGWKRYLQPVAVAIPVLLFLPMYSVVFPNKSPAYIEQNGDRYKALGLLRWEDGKDHSLPQDFADMQGWKELAQKVAKVHAAYPDPGNTLVLCDNYGQAGAINYYTNGKVRAVSFNADYVEWFELSRPYRNLVRVISYDEVEQELRDISPYFDTVVVADSLTNRFARERGTTIVAFSGAKVDVNAKIREEVAEVKKR